MKDKITDKKQIFRLMYSLGRTGRDIAINSGFFNEYLEGYLKLTLQATGTPPEKIKEAQAQLKTLLEHTGAETARKCLFE